VHVLSRPNGKPPVRRPPFAFEAPTGVSMVTGETSELGTPRLAGQAAVPARPAAVSFRRDPGLAVHHHAFAESVCAPDTNRSQGVPHAVAVEGGAGPVDVVHVVHDSVLRAPQKTHAPWATTVDSGLLRSAEYAGHAA
jgi:hypothetical protein